MSCAVVSNTAKTATTGHGSFWHFSCKNHNGLTFFGKSRATKSEAEQALKRHQQRKHGGLIEGAVEPTTGHPKMLC
jgi:hypothetical protein